MNRVTDKRIKKFLVVDTETTTPVKMENFTRNQLVFDFGFQVVDKKGNVFQEGSYVVEEIFYNRKYMENAYFWKKYPQYLEDIANGKRQVIKWIDLLVLVKNVMEECNVSVVSAYNLAFDLNALEYTHKMLYNRKLTLFNKYEHLCIMGMAVETICQQKTFQKMAMRENWVSASGKFLSTKAETVYKYISNDLQFIESHTALEDVVIETQIMARAFRQHKKMSKGIVNNAYRKVAIN